MPLGGNRLCQQATVCGALTSKDLSIHTRARTKWLTNPLTIVLRVATEDCCLPLLPFLRWLLPLHADTMCRQATSVLAILTVSCGHVK
jgi:hypothetical protein